MPSHETIISRIRKLLAFNKDNATEAEIENALSLAQRLMEQHAIDEDDLTTHTSTPTPRTRGTSPLKSKQAMWERILANAVALVVPSADYYTSVRPARNFPSGERLPRTVVVHWFGPVEAVEVAKTLFDETRLLISALASRTYGGPYRGPGRSYAEGFATTLKTRARATRATSPNASRLNALALRTDAANAEWLRTTHAITLQTATFTLNGAHDDDAHAHGRADAANLPFSPSPPTPHVSTPSRPALT